MDGCEVRVHVAGAKVAHQYRDLYHYNPYFGTDVHFIRFWDDELVLVYHEKHRTYLARFTTPWITLAARMVEVDNRPVVDDDLLVYEGHNDDLVFHLWLPTAEARVPLPLPKRQGRHALLAIERDAHGVYMHWTDRERIQTPGEAERRWTDLQRRRFLLPPEGAARRPSDLPAFWGHLSDALGGADAPEDGPDFLVATAGLPFWQTHNQHRDFDTHWRFLASYWQYLRTDPDAGGAGRPEEAAAWLAWFDHLGEQVDDTDGESGWNPEWEPMEGAAELALIHIRRCAAVLATACHTGTTPWWTLSPRPIETRLTGVWATDRELPAISWPPGFVRLWDRLPRDPTA